VRVQVAAEVALAYVDLRASQVRRVLAGDTLSGQTETLQITDWRQQAGLASVLEVEQARAAAAQTHTLLPVLQARIAQDRHALAVLAGAPPAAGPAAQADPPP
jgi:outer membrane protein, multidrug efflux system